MNTYTVVCGGSPLVTLHVNANSEYAALQIADALLKDGVQARVEPLPVLEYREWCDEPSCDGCSVCCP